ncbi:MAG: YkgJ family cysteine cluster protein [Methanomicrobiales archaeon]|nr:YkgJ family cysteine cluster protein [Methanomicrobiales archaeon]
MQKLKGLSDAIARVGFSCRNCGKCCRSEPGEPLMVMISPHEVRCIMEWTGLEWDEIARPFPAFMEVGDGSLVTFEWCLREERGECIFHSESGCIIYPVRPLICRTYPFVLDGSLVGVSDCEGVGYTISPLEALHLAKWLFIREGEEREESERVRQIFDKGSIPRSGRFVIDGEGVKRLHG